jgi:hypothetical protein
MATGTSDFDIVLSQGQAILDGPSVSMAQLVKYFKSLHSPPPTTFPSPPPCPLLCFLLAASHVVALATRANSPVPFSALRYAERRRRHLPAPARRRSRVQEARHPLPTSGLLRANRAAPSALRPRSGPPSWAPAATKTPPASAARTICTKIVRNELLPTRLPLPRRQSLVLKLTSPSCTATKMTPSSSSRSPLL